MADELTQVDATPAPEGQTEQPKEVVATEPTPPDTSWLNEVDPETLEWMKTKGKFGYKKWNQENMALKEKQAKLDSALSRLAEKPVKSEPDLTLLEGRLSRLVDAGKLSLDEARAELNQAKQEALFREQQAKVLTEDKLDEVLTKREMEKAMRAAEKELVAASNGKMDEDDAAAFMAGYVSSGMDVDEAKEKIIGFFSSLDKAAKETAKETVKKVVEPKQAKIVTPGVLPSGPPTDSEDEILARVKDLARRGVPAN